MKKRLTPKTVTEHLQQLNYSIASIGRGPVGPSALVRVSTS
jgi:hypothetical protein